MACSVVSCISTMHSPKIFYMKKVKLLCSIFALGTILFLQGCIKDTCKHTQSYTWFVPLYKSIQEVRNNIKSSAAREIKAPGKLFIIGNYIFLNEINKGVHIIDNRNPALPVNKAFIDMPGNVDIAVKGNYLYADLYADLVVLDISDPLNVTKIKIAENIFPERIYGITTDNNKVIYDWVRHDTTINNDCGANIFEQYNGGVVFMLSSNISASSFAGGAPSGIAGSMARFSLINNILYTVGNASLNVFDITSPQNPILSNTVNLNWGIETIYPFKDRLFIGGNTGMYIFNIANPASPAQLGTFAHARVCDPVIADDKYAFVTLRNGSTCAGFLNELDVVDITNLTAPVFIKKYDLTNPHGLSKDGNLLFICDGAAGFKIFTASDVNNIQLKKQFTGLETYDVIAYNGLAIVIAQDGLYQYDYSNSNNIRQISKISINQ